eukprot:4702562-Pleurochrysis_carterae.AAC.2
MFRCERVTSLRAGAVAQHSGTRATATGLAPSQQGAMADAAEAAVSQPQPQLVQTLRTELENVRELLEKQLEAERRQASQELDAEREASKAKMESLRKEQQEERDAHAAELRAMREAYAMETEAFRADHAMRQEELRRDAEVEQQRCACSTFSRMFHTFAFVKTERKSDHTCMLRWRHAVRAAIPTALSSKSWFEQRRPCSCLVACRPRVMSRLKKEVETEREARRSELEAQQAAADARLAEEKALAEEATAALKVRDAIYATQEAAAESHQKSQIFGVFSELWLVLCIAVPLSQKYPEQPAQSPVLLSACVFAHKLAHKLTHAFAYLSADRRRWLPRPVQPCIATSAHGALCMQRSIVTSLVVQARMPTLQNHTDFVT